MPRALAQTGRDLGVEHEQRGDERPAVADHARLADQRAGLERGFEVGRRDVLAARGDDELLLAVDDLQVAVVVELADVAGVEPAVGVEHLGRLLGCVRGSPRNTLPPRQSTSPSSAEHAPRRPGSRGRPCRPDAERRPRHRPARLGEAVDLRERHAERAEELEDLERDRRGAGDRDLDLVEADLRRARLRAPARSAPTAPRSVVGERLAAARALPTPASRPRAPASSCSAFAGSAATAGAECRRASSPTRAAPRRRPADGSAAGTARAGPGPGTS